MLSRFASDRTTILIERPFEIFSLARPRAGKLVDLRTALGPPRRQSEGLTTIRPLAWWLRDADDVAWRVNRALYRPWLRRALRLAGAASVLWVYDNRLSPLLDGAPRELAAYHCTEDYIGLAQRAHGDATAAWVALQERELCRRVDVVFAVSEGLAESKRAIHAHVHVLVNGVDTRLYRPDPTCLPACALVRDLPSPRLGYVGALNYRIDVPLLEAVADRYSNGSLVLVGAADGTIDGVAWRRLTARPNVHLLGHRPPQELAALIAHLDVCLIPFVTDEWFIRAGQPLKTFEYLGCGKAVVSTWMPNLLPWSELVALTRDRAGFLAACEAALTSVGADVVAARVAAARANSWDDRFADARAVLASLQRAG